MAEESPNILYKTRTYLVGHMQYADGRDWRGYVEKELENRHILCFNPYRKPFVKDVAEDEETRAWVLSQMEKGYYNDVADRFTQVRNYDLNLVDRSDFIIAHLVPEVASWGSAEEIVTATRMKKPIFVAMDGGKSKTPLWLMGMMPHEYIYDSIEDVVHMIGEIDDGNKIIDSDRWRLLRKDLRLVDNFEEAITICRDYSHEIDYDEAVSTIRLVINKANQADLTDRLLSLGYVVKSSYKIGNSYSVVYQKDYSEEDFPPDTGEAPF